MCSVGDIMRAGARCEVLTSKAGCGLCWHSCRWSWLGGLQAASEALCSRLCSILRLWTGSHAGGTSCSTVIPPPHLSPRDSREALEDAVCCRSLPYPVTLWQQCIRSCVFVVNLCRVLATNLLFPKPSGHLRIHTGLCRGVAAISPVSRIHHLLLQRGSQYLCL